MIGRNTQFIDCRESMGLGRGGGLAQRGTLSEAGSPDVIAIGMSPGRRHITKPVCEIGYGLRREGIQVSVLVLEAGSGIPQDEAFKGYGPRFGLNYKEIEQIARHKLALIHLGNIDQHVVHKTRMILSHVDIPTVIACQNPVDFEDFAKIGVKTRLVMPKPENIMTKGTVVEIVSGITRGETCSRDNLNKLVKDIRKYIPS